MQERQTKPNLYLIGFMATGKSAVGRAVADRAGMHFIDSDGALERQIGMSIKDYFAIKGESAFRQLERNFIQNGHPGSGCVVSCGGGLAVQPGMMEILRKKGVVGALFASTETILQRTRGNRSRPLLNVDNPRQVIEELLQEREPYYMQADFAVTTDYRTLPDVVHSVWRNYRNIVARKAAEEVKADPTSS